MPHWATVEDSTHTPYSFTHTITPHHHQTNCTNHILTNTPPTPTTTQDFMSYWNLLSILLCILPMIYMFDTKKKRKYTRMRHTKLKRKKYPMASNPGTRSKYGKSTNTWNMVYDPREDKVIAWTNQRVRIYQRRGRRMFTYQKGQRESTFPRHALPISGEWQGSKFIVTNISHWHNPPTATPPQHNTPTATTTKWNTTTNRQVQPQEKTTPRPAVNCHLRNNKSHQHKRTLRNRMKDQWKSTIPTSKEPKSKDSMARSRKWQHKARQLICNWTQRHMDAYLAIPEKAMEWNVEPG